MSESRFETNPTSIYGGSKRGSAGLESNRGSKDDEKVWWLLGEIESRTLLLPWCLAPMVFDGSLDAAGLTGWLSQYCLPALDQLSRLILDNVPIHRKTVMLSSTVGLQDLVEAAGDHVLFLPKYSPDCFTRPLGHNKIEDDFSALKRAKMYPKFGTSIDEVIRNYCVD